MFLFGKLSIKLHISVTEVQGQIFFFGGGATSGLGETPSPVVTYVYDTQLIAE